MIACAQTDWCAMDCGILRAAKALDWLVVVSEPLGRNMLFFDISDLKMQTLKAQALEMG